MGGTIIKFQQASRTLPPKYRPDIDGLRGISVIAVVLYHARVPGFDGGYVGVDVFFVISGFLITSIILNRTEQQFGIVAFYERRVRRLFPALFSVLLCCAAISAFVLLPGELDNFGQSLVATTLFVPNVFFWRQSGYFAPISENAPLLHLWSLGVEEQFYLLYPATLVIITRFAEKNAVMIVATLASFSFILCLWAVEHHPSAAFYLAPTRAWELLLGALVSLGAVPRIRNDFLNEIWTAIGFLLIGWSVINLSGKSAFPGLNALVPCAGAAIIIHAGITRQTIVARALSLKPVVFVGLISYSLYLWHWPLLAFSRRYAIRSLDSVETGIIIVMAFLISAFSWSFIEQPYRKPSGVWRRRTLFKTATGIAISTIALGATFSVVDGFPQRVSPAVRQFEHGSEDTNPDRDECHVIPPAQIRAGHLCKLGNQSSGEPSFIVWGDSHADAMMPAFKGLSEDHGSYGLFASFTSCPPLVGVTVRGSGDVEDCREFNDEMLSVIEQHETAAVVLVAHWSHYMNSDLLVETSVKPKEKTDLPFSTGLNQTLEALSRTNRKIWLVQQVPVANYDIPSALAMATHRGIDRDFLRPSVEAHEANTSKLNEVFAQAQKRYLISLINPQYSLCGEVRCDIEHGGKPLYRDYHHLSTYGAQYLRPSFERIFTDHRADQLDQYCHCSISSVQRQHYQFTIQHDGESKPESRIGIYTLKRIVSNQNRFSGK